MAGLAIMLMILNGIKLYAFNEQQARQNNDIAVLVRTLEILVKEHGHEPGFSFYVAPQYPGNFVYEILRRKDDPLDKQYSFAQILYPRYFTDQDPRYKFLVK